MKELPEGDGTPVMYAPVLPVFRCEPLTPDLVGEVAPMLQAHYREVAQFRDIPLDPDWLQYFKLQEDGRLLVVTARYAGRLVGYNAFFVGPHIHYKTWRIASNDVIFINRLERGFGKHFRAFCDQELRARGWKAESYHVKVEHAQWEEGLRRDGFVHVENVWIKRLDQ